jgi:hypothetical protein
LLTRNIAEILLKLALKTINLFLISFNWAMRCHIHLLWAPKGIKLDETEDKQTNFTVNLGSGVVLPCKVEGDPLPTIVWYKDESPISMTDLHYFIRQDSSLEIFSSDRTDTGEYRCTASNIAGNVEKTVSLFSELNISRGDNSPCTNNDSLLHITSYIRSCTPVFSCVCLIRTQYFQGRLLTCTR